MLGTLRHVVKGCPEAWGAGARIKSLCVTGFSAEGDTRQWRKDGPWGWGGSGGEGSQTGRREEQPGPG